VDPVRQGEPLFANKDMRRHKKLRRFAVISVHGVNRKALLAVIVEVSVPGVPADMSAYGRI
jgi:hypothetical protein